MTYKAVLLWFKDDLQRIFDNRTCLLCITRAPENNTLDCGHLFCKPYVVIHGFTTLKKPWNFLVNLCLLYNTANKTRFLLKPYIAKVKYIVLNGAHKDVFAAKCLKELQNKLKLNIQIQKYFDIVLRTGSGLSYFLV
jgi:hypothetical protein